MLADAGFGDVNVHDTPGDPDELPVRGAQAVAGSQARAADTPRTLRRMGDMCRLTSQLSSPT